MNLRCFVCFHLPAFFSADYLQMMCTLLVNVPFYFCSACMPTIENKCGGPASSIVHAFPNGSPKDQVVSGMKFSMLCTSPSLCQQGGSQCCQQLTLCVSHKHIGPWRVASVCVLDMRLDHCSVIPAWHCVWRGGFLVLHYFGSLHCVAMQAP